MNWTLNSDGIISFEEWVIAALFMLLIVAIFLVIVSFGSYDVWKEEGELYGDYLRRTIPESLANFKRSMRDLGIQLWSIVRPTPKAKRKNKSD